MDAHSYRGHATLFSGKNRHCGLAISSGVRYVLAGFLAFGNDDDDDDDNDDDDDDEDADDDEED